MMDMERYDIVIAGSGAAGLSLAYYLSQSPRLKDRKILLLDKAPKTQNDRTWGFWTSNPIAFDSIISYRFDQAEFISKKFSSLLTLAPYQYQVLEGLKFYTFIKEHLQHFPNIQFQQEEILSMQPSSGGAMIQTSGKEYQADWVFNSCFLEAELKKASREKLNLKQHFKGWIIQSPEPVFDTSQLRLFDFRTPQKGAMRFFYLIPQAPDRALVEYTLFSPQLLEPSAYEQALRDYIHLVLQLKEFEILDQEWGVIPMTSYQFPALQGERIINIGSVGGASKPSTGYTFLRIQDQCQEIVKRLEQDLDPGLPFYSPSRFRLYDQMLLNIISEKGELSEEIFAQLFKKNPPARILKFLDENTRLWEELLVMNSVPRIPFIKSFLNLKAGLPF